LSLIFAVSSFFFLSVYQDIIILFYHLSWFLIGSLFNIVILVIYYALFSIDLTLLKLWFSYTKIGRM